MWRVSRTRRCNSPCIKSGSCALDKWRDRIRTESGQDILALYRERGSAMTSLARSILRGIADPADAVASALERLIAEGSADAERLEHLTRNEANSLRTKTLRSRRREVAFGLLPDLAELEESLAASGRGLPLTLASFPEDFDAAVRELPETERETFILTDLRGLDQEEAAAVLDVNQSTISRRLDAARARVRKELT